MFWDDFRKKYTDVGLLLFRVVVGYFFLLHGLMKFGVLSGTFKFPAGMMLVAGTLEVVIGLLVLLGLFTAWAGFIGSGQMAVAYWMAHAFNGKGPFWNPLANGGEMAALFSFALLLLFFLGAGTYSLDEKLKR